MRRIGGVVAGGGAQGVRPGGARPGGGFRLGAAPGGPGAAAGAAPLAPLGGGLLALQETTEAPARDADAARRGGEILAELDGLLLDLLSGKRDPARLARLAALEHGEEGADPILREAVQGIALRARVELARRDRDGLTTPA